MLSLSDAVLVRVGGGDNARAVGTAAMTAEERDTRAVAQDLRDAALSGAKAVVIVGGEPLMRRDLRVLLGAARKLGIGFGVATNGRMLVYPEVRRALNDGGLSYARVALHAADPAIHDALVGVQGAHEQTWKGLAALLLEAPPSCRVEAACTVVASNRTELETLVEAIVALPRRATLGIRFVAPLDWIQAQDWLPASSMAEAMRAALHRARRAGADVIAAWEGLPPCLLPDEAHLRDELLRYGVRAFGPSEAGTALPRESEGSRSKPFPCQECAHEATCPGVPAAVLSRDGEAALRPERRVRANSFNYELDRDLPAFEPKAGACPVPALVDCETPARGLILISEGAAALYRSDTGDFTDDELRRVKDELEQVYVDRNERGTLQEFLRDVVRVRIHPECLACPDRRRCCEAAKVDTEPAFEREERWLRKEISRIRGRVLDVGCGDQLYRDELRGLIDAGLVQYHGLDPDEQALERLRSSGMGGTLHHGTVEAFSWEPGYFDYVLALRSVNHFRDMERAFRNLASLLRVQGQFVLCDSVAYGLLRTSSQARYADQNAPVGHEHYRNWSSHQLVEFARRFPFRVDVHRPVSAQGCNQWIVKLMRIPDGAQGEPAR